MEDTRTSFLQLRFPYNSRDLIQIKEVICSLLNCEGGFLFIGILKDGGSKFVVGNYYSESQKEDVLKSFRRAAQVVEPDILTNKMYLVEFVPIRESEHPYEFMPGMFVVKVAVKYGLRDDIYSYRENENDYFAFRNDGEVVHKEGRQLLKNLRERIRNPLPIPMSVHEGPCEKPDIGEQTHDFDGIRKPEKVVFQEKELRVSSNWEMEGRREREEKERRRQEEKERRERESLIWDR